MDNYVISYECHLIGYGKDYALMHFIYVNFNDG